MATETRKRQETRSRRASLLPRNELKEPTIAEGIEGEVLEELDLATDLDVKLRLVFAFCALVSPAMAFVSFFTDKGRKIVSITQPNPTQPNSPNPTQPNPTQRNPTQTGWEQRAFYFLASVGPPTPL